MMAVTKRCVGKGKGCAAFKGRQYMHISEEEDEEEERDDDDDDDDG